MPHRVPNLAQTRHTIWARDGRTRSTSAHRRQKESDVVTFLGDHTRKKLVNKEAGFRRFPGRLHGLSGSSLRLQRSIRSDCKPFSNLFQAWPLRPTGGEQ